MAEVAFRAERMDRQHGERAVTAQVEVPAVLDDVWDMWTTEAGARTFFAPACRIDLRPGGAYEMLFDLEAEPGSQGGEGNRLLAIQPRAMLSFSWNAPPELPTVRGQRTHVSVRFSALGAGLTRVSLRHDGWGEGGEWDEAFKYFERAWNRVVLPRLRHRFEHGPIDWDHLPDL
ncbi:MAG: SRPBCC domain-containing protein [Chloroflexi bacterium]|nr:SRPBCC domain-containing protein [Chloroflexota bacterium]